MGDSNGRDLPTGRVLGAGGVAAAIGTLLWASLDTARHESATALDVAAQHGQEIQDLRVTHREMWTDLARVRAQAELGGRFTREDGERLEALVIRLRARVERLEQRGLTIEGD